MEKKIITLLLIVFIGITNVYSQKVSCIVLKGKVTINDAKKAQLQLVYEIKKETKVNYEYGCNIIFYQGVKFFNFVPKAEINGQLSFNEIVNKINQKWSSKPIEKEVKNEKIKTFYQYIKSKHQETAEEEDSKGVVYGGIKGLNGNNAAFKELDEYAVPSDSTKTALNSIELFWKFPNKLNQGKLIVTNTATNKVILNKAILDTGSEVVQLDGSGWYEWEIISGLERKVLASNSFVVLTPEAIKIENDNLNEFKSSIAEFDIETQQLLIEDYLEQKQLILN